MRPNNEYTTEKQRFFFPSNAEAEHHKSLDTSRLPNVEVLDGIDAYAIIVKPEGGEVAIEQNRGGYNIPAGAVITKVATINKCHGKDKVKPQSLYQSDEFSVFVGKAGYIPGEGDLLMVAVDRSKLKPNAFDERINKHGVMLVKNGDPLPSLAGKDLLVSEEEDVRYGLIGVITSDNKLINWHTRQSAARYLVDYCVANALSQNRLEHALLVDELGHSSLVGEVTSNPVVASYLEYVDAKLRTNYVPAVDPQDKFAGFKFDAWSIDDLERRRLVGDAARRFMTEPRAGDTREAERLKVDELLREFRKDTVKVNPEARERARQELGNHIDRQRSE